MQNWQILVLKNLSPLPTQAQEYSSREVVRPVFDFVAACLEIIAATSCRVPRILCDRRKKLRSCSAEGRVSPLCNTVFNRNMEILKHWNTVKHRVRPLWNTEKLHWMNNSAVSATLQYWNTTLLKNCNIEILHFWNTAILNWNTVHTGRSYCSRVREEWSWPGP